MKDHLGSQIYWPLYEELQRLNTPLCVHNRREGPAGEKRFDSFIFMHTIGRPVETFIQFAGLMYGGIAERFPKLRISFLECGVGWVPYWIERMDEEWEKRGKVEAPHCKHKPSEYISSGQLVLRHGTGRRNPALRDRAHWRRQDRLRLRLSPLGRHVSLRHRDDPRSQGYFGRKPRIVS